MTEKFIQRLDFICNTIPPLLNEMTEEDLSYKSSAEKWSRKQILGHLIDSATNNHQRFIRVQFETIPFIKYDQNNWNHYSNYQELDAAHLIQLWTIYNRHLIHIIRSIPEENLLKECNIGKEANVTLLFVIEDYVRHLEHHLSQIV